MVMRLRHPGARGFTLQELMIVIAIAGLILALAAPSFNRMIQLQRLRSINSQLVTDLQFARSEAAARNSLLRVVFRSNADMTCYSMFTAPDNTTRCDCRLGPGAACAAPMVEVRTAQVQTSLAVHVFPPPLQAVGFGFDPTTGGLYSIPTDLDSAPMASFVIETYIDDARKLHTILNAAGRPAVCTPPGSTMTEASCP
jgi:type IV fimbrial biogenesis protein FimT